jgi:putative membrane protein
MAQACRAGRRRRSQQCQDERMSVQHDGDRDNAMVRFLKRKWLAIVLVVLAVIVAIQNGVSNETSTVRLLWGSVSMPTWFLIALIFVVGGIVGWVLARNRAARKARRR